MKAEAEDQHTDESPPEEKKPADPDPDPDPHTHLADKTPAELDVSAMEVE